MTEAEKERLQASLDYHNQKAQQEDEQRRQENRNLADNMRRVGILRCWGGDQC